MAIKYLLFASHFEQETYQIFIYMDFTVSSEIQSFHML
jgi:hypothetical protein